MGLVLLELPIEAKIIKAGDDVAQVVAGQWVQIRTGPEANPIVMLQVQCPQGKKWAAHVYVNIEETDA